MSTRMATWFDRWKMQEDARQGAEAAGLPTPRGMGPALAYCEAVRLVYTHLAMLTPGLRLAAITAVTELLKEDE